MRICCCCINPSRSNLNVDLLLCFKCIILLMHAVQNCGAAASFVIVVSFFFLLCDGGCFFVTQSDSIKVSRWSAFVVFSSFVLSFFHGHCVSFFEWSPTSTVFGYADPCFVGLTAAFDWVFSTFKFLFEKFVDVIFPSFSWSPDRSVDPVSCVQFRVPDSSLSQPSITW